MSIVEQICVRAFFARLVLIISAVVVIWPSRLQAQVVQPISLWRFDESGGTTALDSAGSINGTLQNGATFLPAAGIAGGAVSLNRVFSQSVTMGDNFNFTTSFSIQAWIRMSPGDTFGSVAVGKHTNGFGNGYFLAINDVGDGGGPATTTKSHFYVNTAKSPASTIVVNDGNWHFLVGTYNSVTNQVSDYVDGQFQGTDAGLGTNNTTAPFLVGGITGGTGRFFTGLIDEVAVYNQALTASEVLAIYSSVPEPTSLGLCGAALLGGWLARRRLRPPLRESWCWDKLRFSGTRKPACHECD